MNENKPEKSTESVCNLAYLIEIMSGKKQLIKEIMDTFLTQTQEELNSINNAIIKADFVNIQSFAHTMKSSVSIMGVSMLAPILNELEELAKGAIDIKKITELGQELNSICKQAIEEIKNERLNYL